MRAAHELEIEEVTLDTPVRIWWSAYEGQEVEDVRQQAEGAGGRDFEAVREEGTSRYDVFFTVSVRDAVQRLGIDVDSLVDGYLPDGAQDHVRALLEEEWEKKWRTVAMDFYTRAYLAAEYRDRTERVAWSLVSAEMERLLAIVNKDRARMGLEPIEAPEDWEAL